MEELHHFVYMHKLQLLLSIGAIFLASFHEVIRPISVIPIRNTIIMIKSIVLILILAKIF